MLLIIYKDFIYMASFNNYNYNNNLNLYFNILHTKIISHEFYTVGIFFFLLSR